MAGTSDFGDDGMAPHVGGRLLTVAYVENGVQRHETRTPYFASPAEWEHDGHVYDVLGHSPVTAACEYVEVRVRRR